ncbi:MAG: hypothetical protein C5B53_00420 [Candidatus Melainabacteria bacterium]|nr:MAG: hypothetical protein C5B53_00420 [Candidatus Melainabacteria bacterium]
MRQVQISRIKRLDSYLPLLLIACLNAPAGRADEATQPASGAGPTKLASSTPQFNDVPSISISTLQPSKFKQKPVIEPDTELKGSVSVNEQISSPSQLIGKLMESALAKDEAGELLNKKSRLHNQKWTQLFGRSKEMLQFATAYQGFETSSEGADVILEEKLKLKHHAAVELVKQKRADALHTKLTCAVMQIAMGLGLPDEQKRTQTIESGRQELIPLVGDADANQLLQSMTTWSRNIPVDESTFARDTWDVLTLQKKSKTMLATSVQDDDVVKSIEARLHKYNHHSQFARVAAKIVGTTTSIVALSPNFAAPAAQAAEFIFVAATGGPEEKKVLQEIYLDRRFESRFERLSQEVSLAVNSYNQAMLTHNPVLLNCSQSLMEGLTDTTTAAAVTSDSDALLDQASAKGFGDRI